LFPACLPSPHSQNNEFFINFILFQEGSAMPNKLGFLGALGMGLQTGGISSAIGAVVVGVIGAAIGGPAVGVTAAVWGASIFGGLGTLLGGFACGMADDSNSGTVMLTAAAATAAVAFGVHQLKPPEEPAKAAQVTSISQPFNSYSKQSDTRSASVFINGAPAFKLKAAA